MASDVPSWQHDDHIAPGALGKTPNTKESMARSAILTYFRVATLVLVLIMVSTFLTASHNPQQLSSRVMMEVPLHEEIKLNEMLRRKSERRENTVANQKVTEGKNQNGGDDKQHRVPDKEDSPARIVEEEHHGDNLFGYSSRTEMENRRKRFPSVDERVRLYMGNWYLPPCANQQADSISEEDAYVRYNYVFNATLGADMMLFRESRTWREKIRGMLRHFVVDESTGYDLLRFMTKRETWFNCDNSYCNDLVKYLLPAMDRAPVDAAPVPILYQFSDVEKTRAYIIEKQKHGAYPNVPHLKKFRYALSKEERDRVVNADEGCSTVPRNIPITVVQQHALSENPSANVIPSAQPIIFKLKMQRHYGYVEGIPSQDKPWSEKKNQAIFRGQFTGRFPAGMNNEKASSLSAYEQCQLLQRCRLVYNSAASSSSMVDAKMVFPILDVRKDFPKTINSIDLYEERSSIEEMLGYKAIIMLEGNDVSSGLKWALYSNSVVLTHPPTKTSWAMEELLEPWVHYIPLAEDLSDVEEKMKWVLDHDQEAQAIAHRGKLWISDLVFHPDAVQDEKEIFDDILRRYRAHFLHDPSMKLADLALEQ